MTVDPLLRRATIRGTLGGCALDVEFAGVGPAQPQGNLSESHGGTGHADDLPRRQPDLHQPGQLVGRGVRPLIVPPPDRRQPGVDVPRRRSQPQPGNGGGGVPRLRRSQPADRAVEVG